jgi:GT2 family glycosyltransferase
MKVLIIIVLYKQTPEESISYNSLSQQMRDEMLFEYMFYMHDNSPVKTNIVDKNVYYSHHPENPGLSFAFNRAAEYAKKNDFNWMLLSDQDTLFADDLLQKMEQAILKYHNISLFVPVLRLTNDTIFSPCKSHNMFIKPFRFVPDGMLSLNSTMPVNSGILIKTAHFSEVGGYDERLKVDYCDFAFLKKIKTVDDRYCVIDSIARQSFSNEETDKEKLLTRFRIYLNDAANYTCNNFVEKIGLFYSVLKHTVALSVRTYSLSFIFLLISKWVCKKNI